MGYSLVKPHIKAGNFFKLDKYRWLLITRLKLLGRAWRSGRAIVVYKGQVWRISYGVSLTLSGRIEIFIAFDLSPSLNITIPEVGERSKFAALSPGLT